MKCPGCGKENTPKEKFCDECGFPLEQQATSHNPAEEIPSGIEVKCPACGKVNLAAMEFCVDCGTDLSEPSPVTTPEKELQSTGSVPATPSAASPSKIQSNHKRVQPSKTMPVQNTPPRGTAKLIMPDGKEKLLTEATTSIGRDDFIRYLPKDRLMYISREHLLISFDGDKYFIRDSGSDNGTKLNSIELKGKRKRQLANGDRIEVAEEITFVFKSS